MTKKILGDALYAVGDIIEYDSLRYKIYNVCLNDNETHIIYRAELFEDIEEFIHIGEKDVKLISKGTPYKSRLVISDKPDITEDI